MFTVLGNNQLDELFHVFIYFMSLHVSSVTALVIRRSNCINTSSGMISLCKWLLGTPTGIASCHLPTRLPLKSTRQRDLCQTRYSDCALCFCASSCGLKDCEISKFNLKRHSPTFAIFTLQKVWVEAEFCASRNWVFWWSVEYQYGQLHVYTQRESSWKQDST